MMIVNDKERLQLEEELLMTCSKAQAINKYIDELEECSKLSELWCKSQQENARLKDKIEKAVEYIKNIDKDEETLNDDTRIYMIQDVDVDEIERILKEN